MTPPPRILGNRGIALGPILFIIAVLALIAAAIASNSQSLTRGPSGENDSAMASAILAQADLLNGAVQRLLVENSCDPTQITFSNPYDTKQYGYDVYGNSNAPSDGSCNVFGMNGGKINFPLPPAGTNTNALGNSNVPSDWQFDRLDSLNVGAGKPAMTAFVIIASPTLCAKLNSIVGVTTMPVQGWHAAYFVFGSWPDGAAKNLTTRQACIQTSLSWSLPPAGTYLFYTSLLAQ